MIKNIYIMKETLNTGHSVIQGSSFMHYLSKTFCFLFLIFLLTSLTIYPVELSDFFNPEDSITGARASGMGETFTAIADDTSAIKVNPAGLAQIKYNELKLMYHNDNDLFGGLYNIYSSIAVSFLRMNTVAASWLFRGFLEEEDFITGTTPELGYSENYIDLAYARELSEKLFLGLTLKYFSMSTSLDGVDQGSQYDFNFDLGVLYKPIRILSLGLSVKNLLALRNIFNNDAYNSLRNFSVNVGAAFKIIRGLTIGADLNDSVHVGAEYWLFNMFGIRSGFYTGLFNSTPFTITAGASVRYRFGEIDYAFIHNNDLPFQHKLSMSFSWGYSANLIDIVSVNIKDMFASHYKNYAGHDVVKAILKNKTDKVLKTTIAFYTSGVMKDPTAQKLILKPKQTIEVKLPAVFDPEKIMNVREDGARNGQFSVSYVHNDRKSIDMQTGKFVLYSRNSFVWDDMNKLGTFITPQDEKVNQFARTVIQSIKEGRRKDKLLCNNFYKAMLIFDALGKYGQVYIRDPASPFGSAGENAIDSIRFPQETLQQKSGDCDDCVMLYSSLLENVGISTVLVTLPGHILMMFDAGITSEKAAKKFPNGDGYLELSGRIWVPVETTMFGSTFTKAWAEGLETMRKNLSDEEAASKVEMANVQRAWQKYPAADIKEKAWDLNVPSREKIEAFLEEDMHEFLVKKEGGRFKKAVALLKSSPDHITALNVAAVAYVKNGIYSKAAKYFQKILTLDAGNVKAMNNLGNLMMMMREYEKAIGYYKKTLKAAPMNAKAKKNLSFAMRKLAEEKK